MAERMEREKQLAAVRAERESVEAGASFGAPGTAEKGHIAQEAERLRRRLIPDMADDVKGEIIRRDIRNYAKSVGWTDQELSPGVRPPRRPHAISCDAI